MSARVLTLLTALGAATMGGVFFAFSTFVMKGLGRLPPSQGVAAMQALNLDAPTGLFLASLLGTSGASLLLAVISLMRWSEPGAALRVAGAAVYLAGCIGVTGAYHVPRNDALAALSPSSAEAIAYWPRYVEDWTAGNHVRAAAGLVAATLLMLAMMRD